MSRDIYSRKVTRWYWNGKSYANLNTAIRRKVDDTIKDEVLGPRGDKPVIGEYKIGREKLWSRVDELDIADIDNPNKVQEAIVQLYAERFPHTKGCWCWREDKLEGGEIVDGDYKSRVCYKAQVNTKWELYIKFKQEMST